MFSVKFTYGVLAKSVEVEEDLSAEVVESLAKLELCGVGVVSSLSFRGLALGPWLTIRWGPSLWSFRVGSSLVRELDSEGEKNTRREG
jgi:hypothetical protein